MFQIKFSRVRFCASYNFCSPYNLDSYTIFKIYCSIESSILTSSQNLYFHLPPKIEYSLLTLPCIIRIVPYFYEVPPGLQPFDPSFNLTPFQPMFLSSHLDIITLIHNTFLSSNRRKSFSILRFFFKCFCHNYWDLKQATVNQELEQSRFNEINVPAKSRGGIFHHGDKFFFLVFYMIII